jgi:membrane protein
MSTETPPSDVEHAPLTLWGLIHYLYRQWHDDRVSGLAAEIGFFALLSLFPLLLVLSALLGGLSSILGNDLATDVENQLTEWAGEVFGADGSVVDAVGSLFSQPSTSALTVGVLATLYTASRGFAAVIRALDVAYGHDNTRGWVGTQVVGLLIATGSIIVGALTLAGLVIGPLLGREDVGGGAFEGFLTVLWDWFRYPTAFVILVLWAATIFHVAPNRRASWRWELPGALFSALLWIIATYFFSLYLATLSSTSNAVFGVIGTAITIELWLYLLAIGLILGAELNSAFAIRRGPAANWTEPELFTRAYRWVKRVVRSADDG